MSEFLRPRMIGPRFAGGKIPLEMLGDFSVLRQLVIAVAKGRYLEGNPNRKRSPRGFADRISLALTGIEKGSATPIIDVEFDPPQAPGGPQLPGMPGTFERYFVEARDAIVDAIAAAEADSLTSEHLPEKCLGYFDRIGRGLREGESIEFTSPASTRPARLTKESRRRLVLASQISEMTEEVRLRGAIPEADQGRMSFELLLAEGRKIVAAMHDEHQEVVLEVFNGYKDDRKALIRGIGKYDRQGSLVRLESIEDIVAIDLLDVPSRLDELRELASGWLDGEGVALDPSFLDWLSVTFDRLYPDELPLPHIYPTVEGGVQAEWSLSSHEVSLSVDVVTHVGEWHVLNTDTNVEDTKSLDLVDDNDWIKLTQNIRSLAEASE